MSFTVLGDLAQNMMLRRQSANLQSELSRAAQELTTGQKADTGDAVRGDFSLLSSLDRSLSIGDAYSQVRDSVAPRLEVMQNSLGRIQGNVLDLGTRLLSDNIVQSGEDLTAVISDAKPEMDEIVGLLNGSVAGRALFSGTQTRNAALISADEIITALATDTAAATTLADFETAVDDWFFAAGGGFETTAYQGGPAPFAPTRISETESVDMTITAQDTEFRQVIRDLAVLSLVADGRFSGEKEARAAVVQKATEGLMQSNSDLIDTSAGLGRLQEKVEEASVTGAAERFAQSEMRNALVAADPFDSAAQLEQIRAQIETLYTVTARTARLSLTEYL